MSYILSLETSCGTCSIAIGLIKEGSFYRNIEILYSKAEKEDHKQTERLIPMIAEGFNHCSLQLTDIRDVILTIGPGSFTGIRIGIAAVKGLFICSKEKINFMTINSLQSMIGDFIRLKIHQKDCQLKDQEIICSINAGRGNFYKATFIINYIDDHYVITQQSEIEIISHQILMEKTKNTNHYSLSYGKKEMILLANQQLLRPNALANIYYLKGKELLKKQALEEVKPLYLKEPDIG